MRKALSGRRPLIAFMVLFVPMALLIGLGGSTLFESAYKASLDSARTAQAEKVRIAASMLLQRMRGAAEDIAFISELPSLRMALAAPSAENLAWLAENYAAYERANRSIDQIRWIDANGRERVRVDRVNDVPTRIPDAQLQDKVTRPYVVDVLKYLPGQIYVSPMDLNIEHGQIEVPYKPTVRIATPLRGIPPGGSQTAAPSGGLVVINYLARDWIDTVMQAEGIQAGSLMLLNHDGYWLYGPNPNNNWGFILGHMELTLARTNPSAWASIDNTDVGSVFLSDGLWSWRNVLPFNDMPPEQSAPKNPSADGSAYVWRVISFLPEREIEAIRNRILGRLMPDLAMLVLAAAVLSAWFAWTRQRIVHLNRTLEERAQASEAAAKAKASFLANMSHEIRTPLNVVLGIAYILERMRLPSDASELVLKIRRAGRSLQSMINDVLDYSKIESGRLEIEHAPFNLSDILENLTDVMGANVGDKNVELVIRPPTREVNALCGDALRLGQILINLTGNAVKFTESGYVELAIETLALEADKVVLRFVVRDTGIGIPEDKRKELFKPFTQADASTTRRFGGTGLGLAISRELVELMGGTIDLVSRRGGGSEFSFSLPFDRVDAPVLSSPELSKLQVLIADDSAIARDTLRMTAETLGWTATVVDSGSEAVEYALDEHPESPACDVIILDWKMPGMNGLAAARTIHDALHGVHAPIILMATAQSRTSLLDEPDAALVDAVLSKPVTPSALYNAVARAKKLRDDLVAPERQMGEGRRLHGVRLLIVDDSDVNREVASRIFGGEGARIALVADGKQAIEWLDAHGSDVDMVLMDLQMPVMDGYETARIIRATPALAKLPIIALTAGAFKAQKDEAKAAGMDYYIAKPFDIEAAIALIQHLADRSDQALSTANKPTAGTARDLAADRGLLLWKDAVVYKRYLRTFAESHRDADRKIRQLDAAAGAAMAHKLKGSAANLALESLAMAAQEVESKLSDHHDAARELDQLQSALRAALSAIDRYAPLGADGSEHSPARIGSKEIKELLAQILQAFNADDPSVVEPLMAALAGAVSVARIGPLRAALESFDFRGGEQATRSLAQELGLELEE